MIIVTIQHLLNQYYIITLFLLKLADFGDLSFAENYERVQQLPIHMMNRYSNFGFVNAAMEMTLVVARRLRLVDYCKRHPDVMKVPLRSPVFVFGIGRWG